MDRNTLKKLWLAEEAAAHMKGWDFSHLDGRYSEGQNLPWNYRAVIDRYRRPEHRLLDMDTGGGEFLLSLGHPYEQTAATEGYAPNVALCREALAPLGIDFRPWKAGEALPFPDETFDLVLNRHGDFDPEELWRVLRPGGVFLTQQVGAENDRELVELVLPGTPLPFPTQYLDRTEERFRKAGFAVLEGAEAFGPIRFFDVGALVWFAHIIPWEFPRFSVESCLPRLYEAQRILERDGALAGTTHRFYLAAKKI